MAAKKKPTKTRKLGDDDLIYSDTRIAAMVDLAQERLIAQQAPVYQRQGVLSHVVRHDPHTEAPVEYEPELDDNFVRRAKPKPAITRAPGGLTVKVVNAYYLRELISEAGNWVRFNEKKGAYQPFAPPVTFAQQFMGRGFWQLPVLTGIVECPMVRADGTIIENEGYDFQSGVYLDTNGVIFPKVKPHPTRDDALAALALLKTVFAEFPFVPDKFGDFGGPSAARSVALSAAITSVVRKAMDNAPLHATDAPSPGTGKTALCDSVAMIATGRPATTMSQGQSTEEFDKRVYSVLSAADQVVTIDNISRYLESDEFCTVLTSTEWANRPLGVSEIVPVSTKVLWFANGNNLKIKGDLTDRTIVARLDARMEMPGQRKFKHDLYKWVPLHRPKFVHAVLTVVRAYIVAGRPGYLDLVPSRARDWDMWVRGALVWLGEPDPMKTRESIVQVDPERETMEAVMRAWEKAIGVGKQVSAGDLIRMTVADVADDFPDDQAERPVYDTAATRELRDALQATVPPKAVLSARGIGTYLGKINGRIVGGLRVDILVRAKGNAYCLSRDNAVEQADF